MQPAMEQMPESAEDQQRREEQDLQNRLSHIDRKLLVLSGKGGVGKSTVAANLAWALAEAGSRVGLLDIDIHGPSIPQLTGTAGNTIRDRDGQMVPVPVNENLSVMSIGFLISRSRDAVIWRGPMKHGVIRQFLKDVAWGELDYLVVDSPPGTGDEPLSIAQLIGPDAGAIIVTTPQDVAISDVRRCVTFCSTLSLPVVGILENMSGLECPKCGERTDVFKRGGGMALAKEMGVPFLGRIPIDPEVVVAGDSGIAVLRGGPRTAAAKALAKVVDSVRSFSNSPRTFQV